MFCKHCGSQLDEHTKFCSKCGNPVVSEDVLVLTSEQNQSHDHTECEKENRRNKLVGITFLLAPFLLLIGTLVVYSIVAFVAEQTVPTPNSAIALVRVVLGILGVFSVAGIFVGIPVGIIFLAKRKICSAHIDARSGKGAMSEIPAEIYGWNWGAAGLSLFWGIANGVWIVLLMFVPFVNLFLWIYLGIKGNELAWRAQPWESVEEFKRVQNNWMPWGIIAIAVPVLFMIFVMSLASR